jgi:thiosulfate/3-mercaptopyruvate sulfurtransferase
VVRHQNGVSGTQVVVYDRSGIFSAPRVWWTFRAFGHERCAGHLKHRTRCIKCMCGHVQLITGEDNIFWPCRVAVLDGGFPAWQAKGYPIDSESVGDADIEAAVHAARQSPGSPHRYQAKLQVCLNGTRMWSYQASCIKGE